ncbi:MAG: hypothetical protein H7837_08625 [Magnetococcus sp. MYC-9]
MKRKWVMAAFLVLGFLPAMLWYSWDKVALEWYRMAAAVWGDAAAQHYLGTMYYFGVVPESGEKAVKWFRMVAEQGDGTAQKKYCGKTCNAIQSYERAAKWYHKAAAQGYLMARFNLGVMYTSGATKLT